jgi:putative chitinase
MDLATFMAATGCSRALSLRWCHPVSVAMQEFGITTPRRQAPFLANVGHESGGFVYTREIWGPTDAQKRYERDPDAPWPQSAADARKPEFARNRLAYNLGNDAAGDGRRYAGHGLIQTTGKTNHVRCGRALGLDLLAHPELLEVDVHAARSAGWYWRVYDLSPLADLDEFNTIVRRINGGLNGYADRLARWERARAVLGI